MGDGYHNNHHACPWLSDMAVTKYEFDLCGKICQIIGKPKKQEPSSVEISK
jgi:fatty-acid desaturase